MRKRWREVLVAEPPPKNLQATVVMPARNEEDLLPSALQALADQKMLNGASLRHDSYEVILLINNSTDGTKQVAEHFKRLYPTLHLHAVERTFDKSHAHIGYVRRLLMDEACRRLESGGRPGGLILSTDSDSRVSPNWICRNSEEIARGADAVGGRIVVLPCEQDSMDSAARNIYRYDHVYRRLVCWLEDRWDPEPHDPWPRHYQHFGASLAITPRAYQAAKRLPPRRYLEDVAFYDALIRHDIRVRHSNAVRVFTSGRVDGRTRFGLSRQLKDWQGSRTRLVHMRVESADFLHQLFKTRRQLRRLWLKRGDTRQEPERLERGLSSALELPARWLVEKAQAARYFGLLLHELRFYERFRSMWPDGIRLARLAEVVKELQSAFEADRRFHVRNAQMCAPIPFEMTR